MALTTDFSGTYNYAIEEAKSLAESMLESLAEGYYNPDQYHQAVIRERQHWQKVFDDPAEFKEFADEFNRLTAEKTNVYM